RTWTDIDGHHYRPLLARGARLLRGINRRVEQHTVGRVEARDLWHAESERIGGDPSGLEQQATHLSICQIVQRQAWRLLRALPGIYERATVWRDYRIVLARLLRQV